MSVNAIKDAVKALAQSLQVTTVFPAALFVLVNAYLIVPTIWPDLDLTAPLAVSIIVSLTLMLSYTLYAFNFPLIRLLEGYKLQDTDLLQRCLKKQRARFDLLTGEATELWALFQECCDYFDRLEEDDIPGDAEFFEYQAKWQRVRENLPRVERKLDIYYPSTRSMVLPTKLGNTVAAFEDYPRTRYGMDPIALWGRLVPVLKEQKYLDFVSAEKAVMDFLMNTCVITVALGLELVYLYLFYGNWLLAVFIACGAVLMTAVFYHGMIIAARQWGTSVRVAFDLYRHALSRQLGLRPTSNFKDERELWQVVSDFFLYRRQRAWEKFNTFLSYSEFIESRKSDEA